MSRISHASSIWYLSRICCLLPFPATRWRCTEMMRRVMLLGRLKSPPSLSLPPGGRIMQCVNRWLTVTADGSRVDECRRSGGPATGGAAPLHVTVHGRPARVRVAAGPTGNIAGIHRLAAAHRPTTRPTRCPRHAPRLHRTGRYYHSSTSTSHQSHSTNIIQSLLPNIS